MDPPCNKVSPKAHIVRVNMKNSNLPHSYIPWPTVMKDILNVWWFVQCRIILFSIQRGHCVICWDSLPCKQFLIQLVLLSFHRFHHCTITISSFYWVLSNHYNAVVYFVTGQNRDCTAEFAAKFKWSFEKLVKLWSDQAHIAHCDDSLIFFQKDQNDQLK